MNICKGILAACMLVASTLFGVFSACAQKNAARPAATTPALESNEHHRAFDRFRTVRGLFSDLSDGSAVYTCRLVDWKSTLRKEGTINRGRAFFAVLYTLRGQPKEKLEIPYMFRSKGAVITDGSRLWPELDALGKDTEFLIVADPKGDGAGSPGVHDKDGIAVLVLILGGPDDPAIAAMQRIVKIHDEKDAATRAAETKAGLIGSQPGVRRYCVDACVHDLAKSNPSRALSLLDREAEFLIATLKESARQQPGEALSANQQAQTELESEFENLNQAVPAVTALQTTIPEPSGAILRTLASGALGKIVARRFALQYLLFVIQRPNCPIASEVLSEIQVKQLRAMESDVSLWPYPNAKVGFDQWLSQPSTPADTLESN